MAKTTKTKKGCEKMVDERLLKELQDIKKELQDIRSILEPKEINAKFIPEDSNGKHYDAFTSEKCI
jgi:hypothetical protein